MTNEDREYHRAKDRQLIEMLGAYLVLPGYLTLLYLIGQLFSLLF